MHVERVICGCINPFHKWIASHFRNSESPTVLHSSFNLSCWGTFLPWGPFSLYWCQIRGANPHVGVGEPLIFHAPPMLASWLVGGTPPPRALRGAVWSWFAQCLLVCAGSMHTCPASDKFTTSRASTWDVHLYRQVHMAPAGVASLMWWHHFYVTSSSCATLLLPEMPPPPEPEEESTWQPYAVISSSVLAWCWEKKEGSTFTKGISLLNYLIHFETFEMIM